MRRVGKSRKAAGSIVGAVFILLIILSSYSINQLNARMQYTYHGAVTKSNQVDVDRKNERLHVYKLWVDGLDRLWIGMINRGSVAMRIKYMGLFNTSASPEVHGYYSKSLEIKPFENVTHNTGLVIDIDNTYLVQLISERGNFWEEEFPFVPESTLIYNNTYILTNGTQVNNIVEKMYEKEIRGNFGNLAINYTTFEWAIRNPEEQLSGFTWLKNAYIDEDDYIVFRINLTNIGKDTYQLGEYTALGFHVCRSDDVRYRPFYIVNNSGSYSDPYLERYNDGDVTIWPGETETLYFAVEDPNDDPSDDRRSQKMNWDGECVGILTIYDTNENYGQSITAIGVRTTN